jgi:3-dehydroquinate synthase
LCTVIVRRRTHSSIMPNRITNSFSITYGYPVVFTHDAFAPANPALAAAFSTAGGRGATPCLALLDDGLAAADPGLSARLVAYCQAHRSCVDLRAAPILIPGGERAKDGWEVPLLTLRQATAAGLCRHSIILAVGGGAMLDAVGLGAALFHRGAHLLRCPTTVLAQCDSGVGVKNGVNLDGIKNLAGTFAPPLAVLNDVETLRSLSDRDWVAGIAEAFKVAAIRDAGFLTWLTEHAETLRRRDLAAMETLVIRCATLHCEHIAAGGDAFEQGSARPLDFGHWAAHKLEGMSAFTLRHGEAVAIGIALDVLYAVRQGLVKPDPAAALIRALRRSGLPVWDAHLAQLASDGTPLVLTGLEEFRQHLGGQLHVTLPAPLGQGCEVTHIDGVAMAAAIADLAALQATLGQEAQP